ncbi:phosphoglycolate phosphatase [Roseomonas marmotae]|uniref:Phosphoglycolate phosphatase n=1 Tax=Roseomonas marmotae TaxID=2768161 RepID=A0ABS3KH55_9PROT|nr:phosphoglycolate phosphatase [Roseomonas marmotae]MBO1076813.1 phosphoglycolate phosphatase [Roseomonas marmotae]QTI78724.1 phosphoglycolate phosphatase [Roseomonas marmotae]
MQPTAIFDLDGTLVDSVPDIHAALNRLMAARGLPPFTLQEVVGFIGDGVPTLLARAFTARDREPDAAALPDFLADYEASAAVHTRPFDGIPTVLETLRQQGWLMAVCTNKPAAAAHILLDALGLSGLFAAVGGGDSFPTRKPDPAHLLATLKAAGGDPARAVMIGDHHNDIAAARGAGVPAIFVSWGYGPRASADGAPVAERPAELPALLAGLLPAAAGPTSIR